MAVFFGAKTNRGQVSVCGDAYGGCVSHLRQHLALFVYMAFSFSAGKDFVGLAISDHSKKGR